MMKFDANSGEFWQIFARQGMRNLRNPQLERGEVCIEEVELELKSRDDVPALLVVWKTNSLIRPANCGNQRVFPTMIELSRNRRSERIGSRVSANKTGIASVCVVPHQQ